jgi:hypothetical protein
MPFNFVKKHSGFKVGFPGVLADGSPSYARSYALEGEAYTAGQALILGTDPGKQVRPLETGDELDHNNFAGFGLVDPTKQGAQGSESQYSEGDLVSVLKFGVLHVRAAANVTAGQSVVVAVASGDLTGAAYDAALAGGTFRIPGARWLDSATSGSVGTVSVGMESGAVGFSVLGVSGSNV